MVFPLWDDGLVLLQVDHGGGQAIRDSLPDRPVLGQILQFLADRGLIWQAATALHWLTWFAMGLITLRLWSILFPRQRGYALPAACLAVTPILCRIQLVLLCAVFFDAIGPTLVFLGILPFLSPAAAGRTQLANLGFRLAMLATVAVGVLLSEYALPSVAIGAVLIGSLAPRDERRPRRVLATIGLLLATASVAYLVYHHLATAEAREGVRPEAQDWAWRIWVIGPRLVTAIWQMTLGTLLQRLGGIDVSSSKELLAGFVAGLAAAGVLSWHARRATDGLSAAEQPDIGSPRVLFTLLAAEVVGILPVIAMGRGEHLWNWSSSRFWVPALPVGACLGVYLLLVLLRPRLQWLVPAICGLLAGYSSSATL